MEKGPPKLSNHRDLAARVYNTSFQILCSTGWYNLILRKPGKKDLVERWNFLLIRTNEGSNSTPNENFFF